jgi:hypothetical protein
LDEVFDVSDAESHMPTDLVEGYAPFGDESSHEARRGAKPFGYLFDV